MKRGDTTSVLFSEETTQVDLERGLQIHPEMDPNSGPNGTALAKLTPQTNLS